MLPNFLIIGAQKAATTSLWQYLRQHPSVFLPSYKEPSFFIDEGSWKRGRAWYESLFDDAGNTPFRGEASPGYTMFPFYRQAPERAAALVREARLVYVIRHPVERIVSAWLQGVSAGVEDSDLKRAAMFQSNYFLLSCYGLQASQWLNHFDRDQLLVIRSEDLATRPDEVLDTVLRHIGVEAGWRPDDLGVRYNPRDDQRVMPGRVRKVAGALRRIGREEAARSLGPRGRLGRLAKPYDPSTHRLPDDVATALFESFRADFAMLREIVGPDMDLWGLA